MIQNMILAGVFILMSFIHGKIGNPSTDGYMIALGLAGVTFGLFHVADSIRKK
jgi:hypothetical protein